MASKLVQSCSARVLVERQVLEVAGALPARGWLRMTTRSGALQLAQQLARRAAAHLERAAVRRLGGWRPGDDAEVAEALERRPRRPDEPERPRRAQLGDGRAPSRLAMALWSVATTTSSPSARLLAARSTSDTAESDEGAACWCRSTQRQPKRVDRAAQLEGGVRRRRRRDDLDALLVDGVLRPARRDDAIAAGRQRDLAARRPSWRPGCSPGVAKRRPQVRIARRWDAEQRQLRRHRRAVLLDAEGAASPRPRQDDVEGGARRSRRR